MYFKENLMITFDYAYESYIKGDLNFFGTKELNRELQDIGEPHIFGINPNNIDDFAKKLSYSVIEHYKAVDLEKKYVDGNTYIHGFHGIVNFKN